MEIYADEIAQALKDSGGEITINQYQPGKPDWLKGIMGMRYARLVLYPLQAARQNASIYHIIDHGYGHLIHFLDRHKTLVTVHDLIPLLHWKGHIPGVKPGRIPIIQIFSFLALKHARHLVAVSENTKKDLVSYLGCDAERISVIYSGVDKAFKPLDIDKDELAQSFGLNNEKNVKRILLSGSQIHKNHQLALKVASTLRLKYSMNIQIIKTGIPTQDWQQQIHEYGLTGQVINLGNIPRSDMPGLVNLADVLLFPSFYEGFGWPPLEAMACGTPIVAANTASLPEVMGNTGVMCDPFDPDCYVEEVRKILTDEDYRRNLINLGYDRARKFTWEETARKLINVYQMITDEYI
jgi:glycosyltransferase involved in cell wall biosynthesis